MVFQTQPQSLALLDSPPFLTGDSEDVRGAVLRLQARGNSTAALTPEEADALATIFVLYSSMMRRTAERLLAVRADADDVVQEVALRLPALMYQYRHGGLGGWLRRIVVTTSLMRVRRMKREEPLQEMDVEHAELPDAVLERIDFARRALATLPQSLREVVVLRLFLDYSHEDSARALGITVAASEIRMCRALKQLRARFGEPHGTQLAVGPWRAPAWHHAAASNLRMDRAAKGTGQ